MPSELENNDLGWLDQFNELADQELGDGSSCGQVHPIVEKWFQKWLDNEEEEPPLRSSVSQAISCLTTEVLVNSPEPIMNALLEHCDEDEVYDYIQDLLMIGKLFQQSLDNGQLDDL